VLDAVAVDVVVIVSQMSELEKKVAWKLIHLAGILRRRIYTRSSISTYSKAKQLGVKNLHRAGRLCGR